MKPYTPPVAQTISPSERRPMVFVLSLVTVTLVSAMAAMGLSLLNVALPTIATALQITAAQSIALITSYQIALVIGLLPIATLGEVFGFRRVYLPGILLFTLAAVMLSQVDTIYSAIAWRFLQGLGGAAVLGVNTAILRFVTPAHHFGKVLGLNTFVAGSAAALGPVAASVILSFAEWQWLFLVNVPLGVLALIVGYVVVPRAKGKARQVSPMLIMLYVLAMGLSIGGLDLLMVSGVDMITGGYLAVGLFMLGALYRIERGKPAPLIPIDLFRLPAFSLSCGAALVGFGAQMVMMTVLPFWLSAEKALATGQIGLLMAAWPLASMVSALLGGYLSDRVAAAALAGWGMIIFAGGIGCFAVVGGNPSVAVLACIMAVCGLGFGLFQTPNNRILLSSAPKSRAGAASGCLGTTRLIGQTLGSSCGALLLGASTSLPFAASLGTAAILALGAAVFSLGNHFRDSE